MFYAIAINKVSNKIRVSAGCSNLANSRSFGCKTAAAAAKRVAEIDKNSWDEYATVQEFASDAAAFEHCANINKA